MAQFIWAHGEGCNCDQCQSNDHTPRFMMIDSMGEQLVRATLPDKGDKAFYVNQHGQRYCIEEDND